MDDPTSRLPATVIGALVTVVAQAYSASVNPVYVVAGNAAVLRCELPSHVADLVTVTSWVDGDGAVFFRSTGGGDGTPFDPSPPDPCDPFRFARSSLSQNVSDSNFQNSGL